MTTESTIIFPPVHSIDERRQKNHVRQIGEPRCQFIGTFIPLVRDRVQGVLCRSNGRDETLLVTKAKNIPSNYTRVLEIPTLPSGGSADLSTGRWHRHPVLADPQRSIDYAREIDAVVTSWLGTFSFVQEDVASGTKGLRLPQIGAVHAAHAHWSVSSGPATIVMPTGTGKTEVMLSLLVSVPCPKVLVVVPTDALRTQIAEKFLTLGVLKEFGSTVLKPTAKHPIVCALEHIPSTTAEVDDLFSRCNVIVTTSSVAGKCETTIQDRMAHHCPYLFIDEAHHAEAPTWSAFKKRFKERKVLQFTATPFREDGKLLDGEIIFKYPLRKAQQEGYFKPIHFCPVVEFNRKRSDEAIAAKAIEQLRKDQDKGHILMARVDRVERAQQVINIYNKYPEFKPVQLHTGIKSSRQREEIRRQIASGETKIVVCVDMLGEGFDLPELKIAAFHDIRKTLAVTLQLAGRFTRSRPDLGNATFIANTANVDVQDELRKLYTRDPDWNSLLPELSDALIGEQVSLREFLKGFAEFADEIPLKTVRPAMSAVVYRTRCAEWKPENFRAGIPGVDSCEQVHHTVNASKQTLIVVTARRVPLDWTDVESVFSWDWELYVLIWSPEQNLLFINSSANSGEYRALAEAVAGDDVVLINGQQVFRVFAGVNRLRLQNVGLTEQLGRNVRYTGRMGADVESAVSDIQRRRARKSVLSGSGYEDGEQVTAGASRKGRIWSHKRAHVEQLSGWCKKVGNKLTDSSIDPDHVLRGTLDVKAVLERPAKMPVGIDWPEDIYRGSEDIWSIVIDGQEQSLIEYSIQLVAPAANGALRFALESELETAELELELFEESDDEATPNYRFLLKSGKTVQVRRGNASKDAADFFYENPPVIWFADGSALEGNEYIELRSTYPPYDAGKIQVLDWSDTDIRKESQGAAKDKSSIQARVIRELKTKDYSLIFDDDGKGEIADVAAVRLVGGPAAPTDIDIELYHCKYSHASTAGHRVEDLYEVCGQAQKSIWWMDSHDKKTEIFTHLLRREGKRQEVGLATRFELGDSELLMTIREMSRLCPLTMKIYIVQPGVSKASVTRDQLQLMSVTENHLWETYQIQFGVITSA